ncbi:hypothetical protein HPC62_16180 [Thermoleptolyngbya sichuanensis A183]|uniref:Uncharacterized protein n=1 Tax=Thermoleptolyngbya sichuanensis A183 TaxID=2737172 RepID=A0A6M8BIP8_9CYAN|nr:hypothetical protein HPC62_16180 [Thermoleptolyngbya sichuanensis A183]
MSINYCGTKSRVMAIAIFWIRSRCVILMFLLIGSTKRRAYGKMPKRRWLSRKFPGVQFCRTSKSRPER